MLGKLVMRLDTLDTSEGSAVISDPLINWIVQGKLK